MKFSLLYVCTLLSVLLVESHAVSPQVYWKSVLPNSPIPKAIKDLLYTKAWDDGNEKVSTNTASMYMKRKDQPEQSSKDGETNEHLKDPFYFYGASKDGKTKEHLQISKEGEANYQPEQTSKDEAKDHLQIPLHYYGASKDGEANEPLKDPFYFYGASKDGEAKEHLQIPLYDYDASKDGVAKDQTEQSSKDEAKEHLQISLYYYGASKDGETNEPLKDPFYLYGASKDGEAKEHLQIPLHYYGASKVGEAIEHLKFPSKDGEVKDHPNAHLFFLANDLHGGKEMKLDLSEQSQKSPFLPKNISDLIPFSSNDLPEVYTMFSVKPDSMKAARMKHTLSYCERHAIEGEEKFCATSLESMVDFATTKLGKNVKALSIEVNAKENLSQKYTIGLVKKFTANKVVACHRTNYAYAVFYCHTSIGTQSYVVSLVGTDETKVKSLAVCHNDTSKWNPKHLAFQVLNVTPGTVPVCHFLPEDSVLWVPC